MSQKVISITPCFSNDIARLLQMFFLQFPICKEKKGMEDLPRRLLDIALTKSTSLEHILKYFKGFFPQTLINTW